ncbi:hypothetical protein [Kribbella sp. NPDC050470]|uniref:hypothetical protein n=1 Tax=unclassified Kribbella TaxID=2644121 RepID=UPI0037B43059
MMQAQGLVRLAPQTLEQLKTAAPLVKDGWNLGTLASEGKFVAQVRWVPAGAATAASVIASMAPALTLMAIQFQLNQIADLAQHSIELTSKVLQVVRQEKWSKAAGYHNTLLKEFGHACEVGDVTDAIYKEIRAGHLIDSARANPRDATLLNKLVADAQVLHDKTLEETDWLLEQLAREFAVIGELPGKRTFRIGGTAMPEQRRTRSKWCGSCSGHWRGSGARAVQWSQSHSFCRRLGSSTEPFRKPLSAPYRCDWSRVSGSLRLPIYRATAGTCTSAMLAGLRSPTVVFSSLSRTRSVAWAPSTSSSTSTTSANVRRPDRSDKAPAVDVITKDTSLTLKFHSWAKSGAQRAEAERFGELLASFMELPASEVPTVRTPELDTGEQLPRAIEA